MEKNYKNTCPGKDDFNLYLNQMGSLAFIKNFESHISNCPMCKSALEGYKLSFIASLQHKNNRPKNISKTKTLFVSVAASITILLTIGFLFNSLLNKKNSYYAINEVPLYSYGISGIHKHKTLSHKSNNEFWSVNTYNQLKVNDKIVTPENILLTISESSPQLNAIYLEIESENTEFARELIAAIKNKSNVPVYPYSTKKSIKKTNLRR